MLTTLRPRTTLGPYEIVGALGAGGMGQVYRARDVRLDRNVAVKVLPSHYASDPDRLKRFEREARLASALNHPNIITIHDIGTWDSVCYIAMELVDGVPLRALLRHGRLSVRQLLDIAVQIADGLAKAHASAIVHRDLKPENIMVTPEGVVKILDFGLAKLSQPDLPTDDAHATTTVVSMQGAVLGTPAYMSPEQVAGSPVDLRTDQFAFGTILYEMATGRNPFPARTAAEKAALVRDDPQWVRSLNATLPPPLCWTIDRCLAKDPRSRYTATDDLARELRTLRDHLSEVALVPPQPARRRWRGPALGVLLTLAALTAAAIVVRLWPTPVAPVPTFQPLTFRRGEVPVARFAPDRHSFVYSYSPRGGIGDIYSARIPGAELRQLGLDDSQLLSVSPSGELAVGLRWRWLPPGFYAGIGTLARLQLDGGAPRPIADNVMFADWGPGGRDLAIVRAVDEGNIERLEYPIGRPLYQTNTGDGIMEMRVSPEGDAVGIVDVDATGAIMSVMIVDRPGRTRTLSTGWSHVQGLAWTPDGQELWFAASTSGAAEVDGLYAVTRSGQQRVVARFPGSVTICDIASDRRVLLTQARARREMTGILAGDAAEHDLTWLDYSFPLDLSPDGRRLLFLEGGMGSAPTPSLWLRTAGVQLPVRLGAGGMASSLSPDGEWVATIGSAANGRHGLKLIPTGTGEEQSIDFAGLSIEWTSWMPDGRRLLITAMADGRKARCYVVTPHRGATPRPVTPEGSVGALPTPDGKWVLSRINGQSSLFPVDGGTPQSMGAPGNEAAVQRALAAYNVLAWADDDHTIFVSNPGVPARILRLDLQTGRTTPWKEVGPSDAAGVRGVEPVVSTRDGREYASTFRRVLSDLYLVDGLK